MRQEGGQRGLGGNGAADRAVVAGPRAEKTGQPLGPSSIPWANSEQNIGWKGLGSPSEASGGAWAGLAVGREPALLTSWSSCFWGA